MAKVLEPGHCSKLKRQQAFATRCGYAAPAAALGNNSLKLELDVFKMTGANAVRNRANSAAALSGFAPGAHGHRHGKFDLVRGHSKDLKPAGGEYQVESKEIQRGAAQKD